MTQEDKELLLKDLCARVPYHPKGLVVNARTGAKCEEWLTCATFPMFTNIINNCRLYLHPMSSMTEDEEEELHSICPHSAFNKTNVPGWVVGIDGSDYGRISRIDEISKLIDWLSKNHFDYRGLIEMGLALEASEGMYK